MLSYFFKNFAKAQELSQNYSNIFKESRWKLTWDIIIIFLSIFSAIEAPLSILFHIPNEGEIFILDIIVTAAFSLDIIINVNLLRKEGSTGNGDGLRKYFKGEFYLDFIAAIPFDIFLTLIGLSQTDKIWRAFRLLRIIKLIRLAQFMRKIRRSNLINPSILRLFFLMFWIIFAAHFISCVWLHMDNLVGKLDNFSRYIKALYWTVTTLTTIGYGDITPSSNYQTIFVMIIEILGAGMYGFVIANIATLIANIDMAKAHHREKLEKINTFMKYRNLPAELQVRINDYYSYLWESRKGYDENMVLADLPIQLKTHVSLYLNKDIIEKVPIFEGASKALIREIILNMRPAIYTPGDYIFQQGDAGHDMYFISKGSVDVVSEDGKTVYATLTSGQFFGEIALLLSQPRNASIRARNYCDLYRLKKDDFDRVIQNFPDFSRKISELAKKRHRKIVP